MKQDVIHIHNINTVHKLSAVLNILHNHKGLLKNYMISHKLPCDIVYNLSECKPYYNKLNLFTNTFKYNVIDSLDASIFINMYNVNKQKEVSQPKFKVGDRVKIDWDKVPYDIPKEDLFTRYGIINRINDNGICVVDHFKYNDDYYTFALEPKHLTLVESKPKCKFKKGDRVVCGDDIKFAGKIIEDAEIFDDAKIYSYKVEFDLPIQDSWFLETSLRLDKYYKKPKPKWSVGTYVEFLEDFYPYNKGEIFKINKGRVGSAIKLELYSDVCLVKTFTNTKIGMIGLEKANIIKWHENKPEKKDESNFKLRVIKLEAPTILDRLQDLVYANQSAWIDYKNAISKYGRGLLQKPEIKISKQKQIKININKPKI